MAKGTRLGGRQKGTPNKTNSAAADILERLKCDPIVGMARIAENKVPCAVCRGECRTRYAIPANKQKVCDECAGKKEDPLKPCIWCSGTKKRSIGLRTCQSCYGTTWEAISPELRGKMFAELAKYRHAQLRAIEHRAPDGGPVAVRVMFE